MRGRGMIFGKSTYKQAADATTYRYHMRWQAISNNILREILIKNKAEVTDMLLTEFDEKDYIEGVREEGERKGREEGRNKMIYSLVEDKSISMEKGAHKLGISVEKLKADMINAGYKCPEE